MEDLFAAKRTELGEQRTNLLQEIDALKAKLEAVELELGAIAAYDDFKAKASGTADSRPVSRVAKRTTVTHDAVAHVVKGAGKAGIKRAGILDALGVKGDKSGEAAVDNRLRDLKADKRVSHRGRTYTAPESSTGQG